MQGFGFLNNIDALRDVTSLMEAVDLVRSDDEVKEAKNRDALDNVNVPILDDDKYVSSKPVVGASGNRPKEDTTKEPDPQLELGLGGMSMGLKKEMARTEAFDGTVDEDPMETANDDRQENVVERVDDLFNQMYGKSYQKKSMEKDSKFDYDFTKPQVVLDNTSMFKVKKGW